MANFKPAKIERQNAEPLSSSLSLFIRANGLGEGLFRQAVFRSWDSISGSGEYTADKYLKNGILYVTMSSSVARSSLSFRLKEVLEDMNASLENDGILKELGIPCRIEAIRLR